MARHNRNKLARLLKQQRTFDTAAAKRALSRRIAAEQWRARLPPSATPGRRPAEHSTTEGPQS